MRFQGCRASLPVALTLLLFGCGGRSFEVGPGDDGGDGDGGSPGDAARGEGGDAEQPVDGGGPDAGTDGPGATPCPIPATISNGAVCTSPGLDCASAAPIYLCGGSGQVTGYAACACTAGLWACPAPTCVEAGAPPPACPLARLVHEGVSCSSPGEDCPGNPTMCSGAQTFYDVFQCTKADVWTRIVATTCGDGG